MELILQLWPYMVTGFLGIISYVFTSQQKRIHRLEQRMDEVISEPRIRQLVDDKLATFDVRIASIKEDVIEINHKLDKLLDLYFKK